MKRNNSDMKHGLPTPLRLRWQVMGVDPGVGHDVAVNVVGQTLTGFSPNQTVKLSVRTGNTAGNTARLEQSVIIP